jgi:hypothetical protein
MYKNKFFRSLRIISIAFLDKKLAGLISGSLKFRCIDYSFNKKYCLKYLRRFLFFVYFMYNVKNTVMMHKTHNEVYDIKEKQ